MGRLLRVAAPGLVGVGLSVAAFSIFWLYREWEANQVDRPTPIYTRRVIPIYDGSVWRDVR